MFNIFKNKKLLCRHPKNVVFDFGHNFNHSVNYCPDCLTIVGYHTYEDIKIFKVGDIFDIKKTI